MGVTVEGGARFEATLGAAAREIGELAAAHQRAGTQTAAVAMRAAPRRTGRLAGSVRSVTTADGFEIGSALVYAPVIHNGWPGHKIPANPFVRRSIEVQSPAITAAHAAEINRSLSKVKGA